MEFPFFSLQAEGIAKLVSQCKTMKDKVLQTPRRMCGLQPSKKDPQVLGKVRKNNT